MLDKLYRTDPKAAKGRKSGPLCIGVRQRVVEGDPDLAHASTSVRGARQSFCPDAEPLLYAVDQRRLNEAARVG
jgi:hypothetical protein